MHAPGCFEVKPEMALKFPFKEQSLRGSHEGGQFILNRIKTSIINGHFVEVDDDII